MEIVETFLGDKSGKTLAKMGDNMGKKGNEKNNNRQDNEILKKLEEIEKNQIKPHSYLVEISVTLICAGIIGIISWILISNETKTRVEYITKDIIALQSSIDQLNKTVSDLKSDVSENAANIKNLDEKIANMDQKIAVLDEKIADINKENNTGTNLTAIKINPGDKLVKTTSVFIKKDNVVQNGTTSLRMSDIAGEDAETNKRRTVKEIADKKVLLPYKEDGQEVYFLGQLDKNGYWDGNCVVNVYRKDQLILITDAKYEHGEMVSYKQVFESGDNRWFVSNRKHKKNVNTGETWSYLKQETCIKTFDLNSVKDTDIMTVREFKKNVKITLDGYYNGQTSNGHYNDSTGNAYLAKYNDDGTVKTFYSGNFKDGQFNDHTGNAWYISFDSKNSIYVYFKGKFTNNNPSETPDNKRENKTNEDIHKIIDKKKYKCKIELQGDSEEIS